MNLRTPTHWLAHDEIEGEDALVGDRAGFELLRQSIDQLLAGSSDSLRIDRDGILLTLLKITEPPLLPASEPRHDKLTTFALVFLIFISIPLLSLFGLYRLIQILFF